MNIAEHIGTDSSAMPLKLGGRPRTITTQALEIGARIKSRREELGLLRVDVSTAIGMTRVELAYIERQCGERSQTKYLEAIAKALVVCETWLRTGEGERPSPPLLIGPAPEPGKVVDSKSDARKAVELRKLLGERAKKRRNLLRMKLKDCAVLVGVSGPTMSLMESCLLSGVNAELENRWEEALKVAPGWLRDPEIGDPDFSMQILMDGSAVEAGSARRANPPQSAQLRIALAARAKERRQALKKRISALCLAIGRNTPAFSQNERCLRKFPDQALEALWERELEVPVGWLRDPNMATPGIPAPRAPTPQIEPSPDVTWTTVSGEIRAIAAWLSRNPSRLRTTDWGQLTPNEHRWAEIFSIRYGVNGAEAATLESCGQRIGVTRERVRQIVEKMVNRAASLSVPSSQFDRLHEEVMKRAPASTLDIEDSLRDFLGENLGLADAQRFAAEILAKKVATFSTASGLGFKNAKSFVIQGDDTDDESLLRATKSACMGMIRSCGAANVFHVCGVVSAQMDRPISIKEMINAVRRVLGFEWISENHGWFWFGEDVSDNRLLNVTRKVMAAAQRKVDVDKIHSAMGRSQRHQGSDSNSYFIEAPVQILTKILRNVSWLTCVQQNDFMASDDGAIGNCLSDIETAALEVIRDNDGVALKYEIEMQVKSKLNVSAMGVSMALGNSPCFIQPAWGLYSVCGCDISSYALEKAAMVAEGLLNAGTNGHPNADGWYRFEFEFSQYHLKHKIIGLPTLLAKKLIPGDYRINGSGETVQITARNSGLTLLSKMMPTIQLLKIRPGDHLVLEINPATMTAQLSKPDK